MMSTVEIPVWLLVLVLGFAAIAALDRVLAPSVRWFFRRRMERVVAQLNTRLDRHLEPFKLMRRQDNIVRLIHDPRVMEAVVEHAHETGVPETVAFEQAHRYAREIVPGFSASVYFGFATRAAKALTRTLYRVRVGQVNPAALEVIDPKATVVFVMNHRSNMDYVLVTWLVAQRSALSYAVGEWARVWPLSRLIRAMGAYFIRRNSRDQLYRRVLARYVQMATAEGVTQAIFPEGGLSLDGRVGVAKMGLLNYIVTGFRPDDGRDVVFIPVALAYDRVIEDRLLVEAGQAGTRRFRAKPLAIISFVSRTLWRMLRRRFPRYGRAAVSFGTPLSLRAFMNANPKPTTEALGARLMAEITQVMPVLPVPLVAAALAEGPVSRAELTARCMALTRRLVAVGAPLQLPKDDIESALLALTKRGFVVDGSEGLTTPPEMASLMAFYAAPIWQILEREPNISKNAATPQT